MAKRSTETSASYPPLTYVSGLGIERFARDRLGSFAKDITPLLTPEAPFRIRRAADVAPFIKEVAKKDALVASAIASLRTAVIIDIAGEKPDDKNGFHDRSVLLLEDDHGRRASVSISLFGTANGIEPEPDETFNPLIHRGHFGGMGIYGQQHDGIPPLIDAIDHANHLAETMFAKAQACGFDHLAGSKTIITDLSTDDSSSDAWLDSPAMQYATGMIFSKAGPMPFNGDITGSDSRQTQETIDRMGHGSRLADSGSYNIVGTTEYGFTDTAGFVAYSMRGTYDALQEARPRLLPPIKDSAIAIQGLGKIGSTALGMYLRAGGKLAYVTDTLLEPNSLANLTGESLRARDRMQRKLAELRDQYKDSQIIIVPSETIWQHDIDIAAPCSTNERVITQQSINDMLTHGAKIILSGANNPFSNQDVVSFATERGMIVPPPVVTNNGSAIAAGMEPRLLHEVQKGTYGTIEECAQQVLIPFITNSAQRNVAALLAA